MLLFKFWEDDTFPLEEYEYTREYLFEKLSSLGKKSFGKLEASAIMENDRGGWFLVNHLEKFKWLDYESAKEIALTWNLHLIPRLGYGAEYFQVTEE